MIVVDAEVPLVRAGHEESAAVTLLHRVELEDNAGQAAVDPAVVTVVGQDADPSAAAVWHESLILRRAFDTEAGFTAKAVTLLAAVLGEDLSQHADDDGMIEQNLRRPAQG